MGMSKKNSKQVYPAENSASGRQNSFAAEPEQIGQDEIPQWNPPQPNVQPKELPDVKFSVQTEEDPQGEFQMLLPQEDDSEPQPKRFRSHQHPFWPLAVLCVLIAMLTVGLLVMEVRKSRPASVGQHTVTAGEDWPVQLGEVLIESKPQRIVSLSPMITQALLRLPEHSALCGVTEYCNKEGQQIQTVGTPLMPKTEEIQKLNPDVILCQAPLPARVERQLQQQGAQLVYLPMPADAQQLEELYAQMGALLMGGKTGRPVGAAVIDRLIDSLDRYASLGNEHTALLLTDLSGMAATTDTAQWALLGRVFRHPLPQETNWMLSAECLSDQEPSNDFDQIFAADPDLLFLPSDVSEEQLNSCLGELRAVQEGHVIWYDRAGAEQLSPSFIFEVARGVELLCPEAFSSTADSALQPVSSSADASSQP